MGCKVHDTCHYPEACRTFVCPYLLLERGAAGRVRYQTTGDAFHARIHRPDLLEAVVKEIVEVPGTVFPAVPVFVALEEAIGAARETKCLPVCSEVRDVMNRRVGWDWHLQMLGEADKDAAFERWSRLMVKHG